LIVGDVEYDSYAGLAGLPKTKQEADAVAALFRATHPGETVDFLTQRAASEPKVRSLLASRGVVHLATHGLFPEATKVESSSEAFGAMARLDSAIVLAKSSGGAKGAAEPDDQKLTADELGQLDMRGVDLVVLSACSSGIGHISSGQGVVGLVGALDRAGARSVACSLWKVDDSATAALMGSFYRHLWGKTKGVGPASALRSAQVELIRREPRTFSHPRFWAAFVISGDPG
jgi:CHAT domain-containing protein